MRIEGVEFYLPKVKCEKRDRLSYSKIDKVVKDFAESGFHIAIIHGYRNVCTEQVFRTLLATSIKYLGYNEFITVRRHNNRSYLINTRLCEARNIDFDNCNWKGW